MTKTLNEWLAEWMGWTKRWIRGDGFGVWVRPDGKTQLDFNPDTDPTDAFKADEEMQGLGWFLTLFYDGMMWCAKYELGDTGTSVSHGHTPAEAMTKAMYKAIEGKEWSDG